MRRSQLRCVEFTLEDAEGGVLLTVTESGFDKIPLERRAKAFKQNESGWGMAMSLIEKHLIEKHLAYGG